MIYRNPSEQTLLNAARRRLLRGLLDPMTGDIFWWDAQAGMHSEVSDQLGLDGDAVSRLHLDGQRDPAVIRVTIGIEMALNSPRLRCLCPDRFLLTTS